MLVGINRTSMDMTGHQIHITIENKGIISLEKMNIKNYANINIPKRNKTEIAFAIGKAYEDLKNYEKSFKFYLKKS